MLLASFQIALVKPLFSFADRTANLYMLSGFARCQCPTSLRDVRHRTAKLQRLSGFMQCQDRALHCTGPSYSLALCAVRSAHRAANLPILLRFVPSQCCESHGEALQTPRSPACLSTPHRTANLRTAMRVVLSCRTFLSQYPTSHSKLTDSPTAFGMPSRAL